MKLSLSWIKEYVQLPADMDLKRLAYDLTMSTVEVEGVIELAAQFQHMLVGVVEAVVPHPNADKLRICKTDIGGGDIREIVCGGSNLRDGMKVAVACPHAMVRWHGEGEPVEIKNAKLRGVQSFGMICASSEIGLAGLFPQSAEAEILDLSAFDAIAGTPLATALSLDDFILEIDNKSMTNRPDLWGHYGIAREIAALYDLPLLPIKPYQPQTQGDFTIEVEDAAGCPRYIGVQMDGLCVKPAPYEMQSLIWRVGMRPINALVDITNYVMLATGQPIHAFDADHIVDHIVVRRARENEELALLNGKTLSLRPDDLVIADAQGPVALAGVMGGEKDSILPDTRRVILEVANFAAPGIRRTAVRYDNRTEASARYEKAIDPERCDLALALAMEQFGALYPEMQVNGFADRCLQKSKRSEIDVELDWLERQLGKRIPNETIEKVLRLLGFDVRFTGNTMHTVAPTWRSTGDISIKNDIMEEIARMYGYENFEPTAITTTFDGIINQLELDIERKIKEYLALRCGMREVFTYPWMSDEYVEAVLQSTEGMLSLATPPSPSERLIRSSLLPNLCKAVAKNAHNFSEYAIFEAAQIFRDSDYSSPNDPCERLPLQRRHIAGAFVGDPSDITTLLRRAKGVLELMPRYIHMEGFTFCKKEKPVWADDVVWLNICLDGASIGSLGLLSKKASLGCGIKVLATMLFELDVDALKPLRSRTNAYEHLPEYPMTEYDVSLLFDDAIRWEQIDDAIKSKKKAGGMVHGAMFVDQYKGKQIPEGKKSVTIRLLIGSLSKTLTSGEIEESANAVIKLLGKTLGAEMRLK